MKTKLFSFLLVPIIMSCATHSGSISSTDINSKTKFVDIAYGSSEASYFLGIGGLSKHVIINDAKKQLYLNRPLKEGESYANFTVDIKRSYYLIYSKQTVTVSADIIKDNQTQQKERFTESFIKAIKPIDTSIKENTMFSVGDEVMLTSYKRGVIEKIKANNKAVIRIENNMMVTKSLKYLYHLNTSYNGFNIGDNFKDLNLSGKIVAIGLKKLIIRNNQSELDIVFYPKNKK